MSHYPDGCSTPPAMPSPQSGQTTTEQIAHPVGELAPDADGNPAGATGRQLVAFDVDQLVRAAGALT